MHRGTTDWRRHEGAWVAWKSEVDRVSRVCSRQGDEIHDQLI
jgi:hypothetical protein